MTKQEFIAYLEKDELDFDIKIAVCQYYIDNYPVKISQTINTPRGKIKVGEYESGLNVTITGGSDKAVNHAYSQLKKRIEEFKLS